MTDLGNKYMCSLSFNCKFIILRELRKCCAAMNRDSEALRLPASPFHNIFFFMVEYLLVSVAKYAYGGMKSKQGKYLLRM